MEQFQTVLILLSAAVFIIALFRRIHLPTILGYLCAGMLIGPGALGLIPSMQELKFLAEFGVVFLMFTIGLEFSFARLLAMKRTLLGIGGLQVLLCTALAMGIGLALGLAPKTAFIAASALALSSTAVVIKQLIEQDELQTYPGRLSISILLFQDIAAVFLLIVLPTLSIPETLSPLPMLYALGKGLAVFILFSLAGHWILRPLLREIAKVHSAELFMITILLVVLGSAWCTYRLQLPMALGAFLAGLMLAETEFRQQIEIDIRPFRDTLLGLFFITIGTLLDLTQLLQQGHQILLLLGSLILGKTLLIMILTHLAERLPLIKAFRTGLILAQGGEFSFVIFTEAIHMDLLDPKQSQVLVAATVLSLFIAPLLIRYNKPLAKHLFKEVPLKTGPPSTSVIPQVIMPTVVPEKHSTFLIEEFEEDRAEVKDHMIIHHDETNPPVED